MLRLIVQGPLSLQAIQAAADSASFVGARAAKPLPHSASTWVASKRSHLTKLMWQAAGIVRNTDDLKSALQQLAGLYVEVRALNEVCTSHAVESYHEHMYCCSYFFTFVVSLFYFYFWQAYGVNVEMVELRNLVTIGELVISSALQRKESRGIYLSL